jgi:hypothetical protein
MPDEPAVLCAVCGKTGPFSGGRHRLMRRGTRTVAIPNPHVGEIRIGLLREILKQAGISDDEWNGA